MGPVLLASTARSSAKASVLLYSPGPTVTHLTMLFPINAEASGVGKLLLALVIVPHLPFSF